MGEGEEGKEEGGGRRRDRRERRERRERRDDSTPTYTLSFPLCIAPHTFH